MEDAPAGEEGGDDPGAVRGDALAAQVHLNHVGCQQHAVAALRGEGQLDQCHVGTDVVDQLRRASVIKLAHIYRRLAGLQPRTCDGEDPRARAAGHGVGKSTEDVLEEMKK